MVPARCPHAGRAPGRAGRARGEGGRDVLHAAALRADARQQERGARHQLAQALEVLRDGGPGDRADVGDRPVGPDAGHQAGHPLPDHVAVGQRLVQQARARLHERQPVHGDPFARLELLRHRHYAGATVFRAIMGFGASSRLRTDRIEVLSLDLPIVVECVDTEDKIAAILPELDEMIGGGLITLERTRVIMYRPELPPGDRTDSWPIDRPAG